MLYNQKSLRNNDWRFFDFFCGADFNYNKIIFFYDLKRLADFRPELKMLQLGDFFATGHCFAFLVDDPLLAVCFLKRERDLRYADNIPAS